MAVDGVEGRRKGREREEEKLILYFFFFHTSENSQAVPT